MSITVIYIPSEQHIEVYNDSFSKIVEGFYNHDVAPEPPEIDDDEPDWEDA